MEKTMFFQEGAEHMETFLNMEEDLATIEIDDFRINFGKILPGEKVVGEFTEIEKKIIAWHLLNADEIQEAFITCMQAEFFPTDEKEQLENMEYLSMLMEVGGDLVVRFNESINSRFASLGKPILYRGNFQIVTSSREKEEIKKEIIGYDLMFYGWVLGFLGRVEKESYFN